MKCGHCRATSKSQVIETRAADGSTYRRRRCLACNETYITEEKACSEITAIPRESLTRAERRERRAERQALGLGKNQRATPVSTPPAEVRVASTDVFRVWG